MNAPDNQERLGMEKLSPARYVAEIEALLDCGVKQITLTRAQLVGLIKIAKRTMQKKRDAETGRLRRALYRAEQSALRMASAAKRERTK